MFFRRIKLENDPRGNDTTIMDDPVYLGMVSAGMSDISLAQLHIN